MLPSDILERGWIQFMSSNSAGTKFCVTGAIRESDMTETKGLRQAIVNQILATGWKPKGRGIASWNDQRARTQAEVVALVRRAEIACGLRPEDNPEQWEIPAAPPKKQELRDAQVEPVLAETV